MSVARDPGGRGLRLAALLALPALLAAGCGDAATADAKPRGSPRAGGPPEAWGSPVPDFALTDQHGRTFRLSEQRGRPVLLFFGYAHCPDVCPTVLSTWSRVCDLLGERAEAVSFAFVTVDPARDTPELMASHLSIFSPSFRGLGGELEDLERVYAAFGVAHERTEIAPGADGYAIDHSSHMFLIDPEGVLVRTLGFRARAEDIARRLEQLLDRGSATRGLSVRTAWSRPTAPADAVHGTEHEQDGGAEGVPGVAYLTIVNRASRADRLLAVRSPVCASAELHETRVDGDRARMRAVEGGLEIPAGATVALEPGGRHVMLTGLARALLVGERFELTLVFERAGELTVETEVRHP